MFGKVFVMFEDMGHRIKIPKNNTLGPAKDQLSSNAVLFPLRISNMIERTYYDEV